MSKPIVESKTNTSAYEEMGFGMPTISIASIELINSLPQPPKGQDPHIDFPGELNITSLKSVKDANDSTALTVKIKMSFKEVIDPNGNFTYLSQGDDLKYIKIAVFQSLNEETTQFLTSNGKLSLNPQDGQYFNNTTSISGLSKKIGSLVDSLDNGTSIYLNEIEKVGGVGNIYGADFSAKNLINQIPYSKSQDAKGNVVYTIPLEESFTIEAKQGGAKPKHLSYFAFSYFDSEEFIKDTKEKLGQFFTNDNFLSFDALTTNMMSDISSDIVISNGELQTDSYVFRDALGKFYNGPKHQMLNGQYMKGAYHVEGQSSSKDYLDKITVYNSKIIDNREAAKVNKVDFNYSKSSDFLINPDSFTQSWLSNADVFKKKTPIFSKMWSSQDLNGKNRFIFSVNMENLLRRNTAYPGLLKSLKDSENAGNGVIYSSLLKQIKIREIKIIRRRVKNKISVSSEKGGQRSSFSNSEIPLVIVHSEDSKGSKLKPKMQVSTDLKMTQSSNPENVGTISEIRIEGMGTNKGVRSFMCTDIDVSNKSDGLYEYTVEIECNDPVPNFLLSKIINLELVLNGTSNSPAWKEYLLIASQPEYFDSYLNRFNVEFLRVYDNQFSSAYDGSDMGFVYGSIFNFAQILSQFDSSNKYNNAYNMLSLINYLSTISHPSTGNPQGIQTVIDFMSNTISRLQKLLSNTTSFKKVKDLVGSSNPHAQSSTPNLVASGPKKSFKISHTFENLFQATNTSTASPIGYDFLSTSSNQLSLNLGGLRLVNIESLEERFKQETIKLFDNESVSIAITDAGQNVLNPNDSVLNRKFSFLSPSFAYLPNREPGDILSSGNLSLASLGDLSDLMLDIIRYNTDNSVWSSDQNANANWTIGNFNPIYLPTEIKRRRLDLVSHFASKGCTVEVENKIDSNGENNSVFLTTSLWQNPTGADLEDFIADAGSIFISDQFDVLNSAVNPNKFLYSLAVLRELNFYKKEVVKNNNIDNRVFYNVSSPSSGKKFKNAYKKDKKAITNLPNHTKSLLLMVQGDSDKVSKNPLQYFYSILKKDGFKNPLLSAFINFNFRILNRIQVFTGFKVAMQSPAVNGDGNWEDLTASKLEELKSGSDPSFYLCRQVRYHDDLSVDPSEILELPVFDTYFIVTTKDLTAFDGAPDTFASFFANNPIENVNDLDISNENLNSKIKNVLKKKMTEDQTVGGTYHLDVAQSNIVNNHNSSPARNGTYNPNDIEVITNLGGVSGNTGKIKAASKLSIMEQREVLAAMGLSKVAKVAIPKGGNPATNNGGIMKDKSLTEEERQLLKTSSITKKVEEQINKLGTKDIAPPRTKNAKDASGAGGDSGGSTGGSGGGGTGGGGGTY